MFGNVGLKDRLTFSAFGVGGQRGAAPAGPDQEISATVIASEAFATYCGGDWATLGKEKLRGVEAEADGAVARTCRHAGSSEDGRWRSTYDRISEAEQVMLLHRNARRQNRRCRAKNVCNDEGNRDRGMVLASRPVHARRRSRGRRIAGASRQFRRPGFLRGGRALLQEEFRAERRHRRIPEGRDAQRRRRAEAQRQAALPATTRRLQRAGGNLGKDRAARAL